MKRENRLQIGGRDDNEEDNEADPEGGHVGMIM